jgi:anti-anti-sigma factor
MGNSKDGLAGQAQTRVQGFEPDHGDQQDVPDRNPFLTGRDEVMVRRLPEKLNSDEGQAFFSQIQKLLDGNQPRFVFDFAQVSELDTAGIHLLLQCLEEVMQFNGDVKLAAVPPGPATILELTGVDRLFEIFDGTADAVQSFHYLPPHEVAVPASLNASEPRNNAMSGSYAAD